MRRGSKRTCARRRGKSTAAARTPGALPSSPSTSQAHPAQRIPSTVSATSAAPPRAGRTLPAATSGSRQASSSARKPGSAVTAPDASAWVRSRYHASSPAPAMVRAAVRHGSPHTRTFRPARVTVVAGPGRGAPQWWQPAAPGDSGDASGARETFAVMGSPPSARRLPGPSVGSDRTEPLSSDYASPIRPANRRCPEAAMLPPVGLAKRDPTANLPVAAVRALPRPRSGRGGAGRRTSGCGAGARPATRQGPRG